MRIDESWQRNPRGPNTALIRPGHIEPITGNRQADACGTYAARQRPLLSVPHQQNRWREVASFSDSGRAITYEETVSRHVENQQPLACAGTRNLPAVRK